MAAQPCSSLSAHSTTSKSTMPVQSVLSQLLLPPAPGHGRPPCSPYSVVTGLPFHYGHPVAWLAQGEVGAAYAGRFAMNSLVLAVAGADDLKTLSGSVAVLPPSMPVRVARPCQQAGRFRALLRFSLDWAGFCPSARRSRQGGFI